MGARRRRAGSVRRGRGCYSGSAGWGRGGAPCRGSGKTWRGELHSPHPGWSQRASQSEAKFKRPPPAQSTPLGWGRAANCLKKEPASEWRTAWWKFRVASFSFSLISLSNFLESLKWGFSHLFRPEKKRLQLPFSKKKNNHRTHNATAMRVDGPLTCTRNAAMSCLSPTQPRAHIPSIRADLQLHAAQHPAVAMQRRPALSQGELRLRFRKDKIWACSKKVTG